MFLNPLISLVLLVTLFFLFINLLYRLLSLQMLGLKQTGLLSIVFAYFVLIIFIIIAVRLVVVLFKIVERFPFLCVGNNSLTVALTLFSKSKLLVSYYILHLEIIYSFYPKFPFFCSLQFCSTNFHYLS